MRENQILGVLDGGGAVSSWDIMLQLYPDIDKRLRRAADNNVRLHLKQLSDEGRIKTYAGKPRRAKAASAVTKDVEHARQRDLLIKQAKKYETERRRNEIRMQENPPSAEWKEPPRYELVGTAADASRWLARPIVLRLLSRITWRECSLSVRLRAVARLIPGSFQAQVSRPMWFALALNADTFSSPRAKLLGVIAGALLIAFVTRIFQTVGGNRVADSDRRYLLRKSLGFLGYAATVVMLVAVFRNDLGGLSVTIGVAGAGVAFALQEVIASFAGWFAISLASFYRPGVSRAAWGDQGRRDRYRNSPG